ncbi:MAG: hypothetical protein FJX67_02830 [Alphaproteobacteria bacterium]|nr:hypothetical protein [Alphaproteobacteria bacterium]
MVIKTIARVSLDGAPIDVAIVTVSVLGYLSVVGLSLLGIRALGDRATPGHTQMGIGKAGNMVHVIAVDPVA